MWDGTQHPETCVAEDHECPLVCNPWVEQYCWDYASGIPTQFCGDVHTPCPADCGVEGTWSEQYPVECPASPSRDCGADYPPRPAGWPYCMDSIENCYAPHPYCCPHERHCAFKDADGNDDWNTPGFCHPGDWNTECPVHTVPPTAPPTTVPPATLPPATLPPATVPPNQPTSAPPKCSDPAYPKECEGHYNYDGTQMPSTCHAADFECPVNCNPLTHQYCWNMATHESTCGDVHVPCPAVCEPPMVKCDGGVSRQCTDGPPVPASAEYCMESADQCYVPHVHCCWNYEKWCADADPNGPGSCHPSESECPVHPQPTHPPGTPPGTECPDPCYCLAPEVACDDGNGHYFCHAAPCPTSLQ